MDDPATDAARYPQVVELTRIVLAFATGRDVTYRQPRRLLRSIGLSIVPILGPHDNAHYHLGRNPFAALVGDHPDEALDAAGTIAPQAVR